MSEQLKYDTNLENEWRMKTPGPTGWKRTAQRSDPDKYLMISADTHANEPFDLWEKRIDKKYLDRIPRVETDEKGGKWRITEGYRPSKIFDFKMLEVPILATLFGKTAVKLLVFAFGLMQSCCSLVAVLLQSC